MLYDINKKNVHAILEDVDAVKQNIGDLSILGGEDLVTVIQNLVTEDLVQIRESVTKVIQDVLKNQEDISLSNEELSKIVENIGDLSVLGEDADLATVLNKLLTGDIEGLKESILEVQGDISSTNEKVHQIEETVSEIQNEISTANEAIVEIAEVLGGAKEDILETQNELTSVKEEADANREEIEQVKKIIGDLSILGEDSLVTAVIKLTEMLTSINESLAFHIEDIEDNELEEEIL